MRNTKTMMRTAVMAIGTLVLAACASTHGYGKGWTVNAHGTRVMSGTVEAIVQIPARQAHSMRQKFERAAVGEASEGLEAEIGAAIGGPVAGVVALYQAYKVFTGPTVPLLNIKTAGGVLRYPVMASSYPKGAVLPTFHVRETVTIKYRKAWKFARVVPMGGKNPKALAAKP